MSQRLKIIPRYGLREENILDTIVTRGNALRFAYMAVSGLLFVGANAAWNGLGYLNPIAWFLEWSSVVLAFLCVYGAVRSRETTQYIYGYLLIGVSLVISAFSYFTSAISPAVQENIHQSVNSLDFLVFLMPLALLSLIILQDWKKLKYGKLLPFLFFISVIGTMTYLLYMFYLNSPAFPTDESVFDMYAAHLFLTGQNPYNPTLMSGAFSFFNFNFHAFDPITPLTTGGYVDSLTYPALSFIVFIPAVILKLKAAIIMIPVLLAPIVIIWYRSWSRGNLIHSSYAILPFLSLLLYVYQGGSADTDALWASLLMLSYIVLPRQKLSGIFFGLSLSVKQLPAIAAPFLLYYVYREYGAKKSLIWIASATAVFFGVNGYFIIQNPGYWFSSMLANELAPLIGIGFGVTQIAFTGLVQIPSLFFTLVMLNLLLVFFLVYVFRYRELKYALFIFPIPIFLFNFRLFPQYLFYWMLISILPMLNAMHSSGGKEQIEHPAGNRYAEKDRSITRIAVAILVAVILGSVALGYHEGIQKSPGAFAINSVQVSGYNATGYVNSMAVNISYQGSSVPPTVFFRLFTDGPVINGNMYQWLPMGNTSLAGGQYHSMTIRPQYSQYSINGSSGFMVVAYYGNVQGSYYVSG